MIHGKPKQKNQKIDPVERYTVTDVPIDEIKPSPENDDIYGEIGHDDQMDALVDSIKKRGLGEPLILTNDMYILSGHRRFFAVKHLVAMKYLEWKSVPCRVHVDIRREGNAEYHRDLAEYNPQRIKGVGSLLKEALLRDTSDCPYDALEDYDAALRETDVDFMTIEGAKLVPAITDKKQPFLEACQKVVTDMRDYWPLSVRQIHYNLLNDPPLKLSPKRSKFSSDHYRYKNDPGSYDALVEILRQARYHGKISMSAIDDPTRPQVTHKGYRNSNEFIRHEVEYFLSGYHRNRQQDQPRHVELFGEKSTLMTMLRRIAKEYYVPLSLGRGFCSTPVYRDMAQRFKESGKDSMVLVIISDFDPEGLELADDAIRTLRDLWGLPIEGHRVAIIQDQIDELGLHEDFNPAKESSSRYQKFLERTGGDTRTWEVEALPPDYLMEEVKSAIEANLDMGIFDWVVKQEAADIDTIYDVRQTIASSMQF